MIYHLQLHHHLHTNPPEINSLNSSQVAFFPALHSVVQRVFFAALTMLCLISNAHAAPAEVDGRAQEVFGAVKDSVLQIRTLLRGSQSQTSIGSGFYVSDDGLIITNYHVVSSHALEPKTYEMEYVASNGERGALNLLAIDVLHDLALLQRSGSGLPALHFNVNPVAKGERLFALGNPMDLGMTIVDGVNNGLREHSFYDTIHFTGAINPGMSGGPVVAKSGELVGINDATMGESIGFLVPSRFASELLTGWENAHAASGKEFVPEITRQLKLHSAALVARLTSKPLPVQVEAGFVVPDAPDPYMRCWANENNDVKTFFTLRSYFCTGTSDVYVDEGVKMGDVIFLNKLYQSDTLDSYRFAHVLEHALDKRQDAAKDNDASNRKHYGKYACEDSVVQLNGQPVKAVLCLRAYRKFKGLYDLKLRVVSLRPGKRAMVSLLNLNGVSYEDGMRMVRYYMGALK